MNRSLSIIICTYNPDENIFSRCLDAIKKASLENIPHQILIIDNNSSNKLDEQEYFKIFCNGYSARLINEKEQGLTPARLRGIQEATGDILVFIDDDNFIAPDFFIQGIKIGTDYEHIGSWSGRVTLEFEKEPEAWTKPYWGLLVNREIEKDYWSNLPHLPDTMPCGAGLFVRKQVADYYLQLHETGKRNIQLDRNGSSLFSGGDNDLAACACDIGMGVGVFLKLKLTHYIPSFRTEKKYLLKLAEGIAASTVVFKSFRGELREQKNYKKKLANILRLALKNKTERQFYSAVLKGEEAGFKLLQQNIKG